MAGEAQVLVALPHGQFLGGGAGRVSALIQMRLHYFFNGSAESDAIFSAVDVPHASRVDAGQ